MRGKMMFTALHAAWSLTVLPPVLAAALNAGVLLLHLSRLREVAFVDLVTDTYRRYRQHIFLPDQDVLNALLSEHRGECGGSRGPRRTA